MNKGYAFGFLIVLLVLAIGMYVAITGFLASREAVRVQPISRPPATSGAASPTPLPLPTTAAPPTPTAGAVVIPTIVVPTSPPLTPSPTHTPASAPPTAPPAAQPTVPPTAAPPPTPVPVPAYQFRLGGPATADPTYPSCCYIFGTVRDAAGNPLEGVLIQAFNEWNTLPPAASKGGNEIGQYNIPIGHDPVVWYVVVVDANGNHISTQTPVQFDPNVANGYRVDWQRTY